MASPRDTVTIACKLPNGLQIDHQGQTVFLKGGRIPLDEDGNPVVIRDLPGGYGLTFNVDKEWWESWVASMGVNDLNGDSLFAPLATLSIFAVAKPDDAKKEADAMGSVESGLEPLKRPKATDKPGELSDASDINKTAS